MDIRITVADSYSMKDVFAIRNEVFVKEQHVPVDIELDDEDAHALHIIAKDLDTPAGCARVIFSSTDAHIGRLAVLKSYRNKGIGSDICKYIIDYCIAHGYKSIWLNSQLHAVKLYEKLGFSREGEIFTEAGIEHVKMIMEYDKECKYTVSEHYDMLIDEENDPVHDPAPLRDYMDKWDGQRFIDEMSLNKECSVLEIGVGTGRLVLRIAPFCKSFTGIDISRKTIERAEDNLSSLSNVSLYCGDFGDYNFGNIKFDIIYSSLTFMHICDKAKAIDKIASLLSRNGRFVLSIDKNKSEIIDTGTRQLRIFPDDPEYITSCITSSGLKITNRFETEFAHIFTSSK